VSGRAERQAEPVARVIRVGDEIVVFIIVRAGDAVASASSCSG